MNDSEIVTIAKPDTTEIEESGARLRQRAAELEVRTDEDLQNGDGLLAAIKDKVDTFKPGLDKKCEEAFGLHRFLTNLRTTVLGPYVDAEKTVKQKMADYHFAKQEKIKKENERLAREAQRKADEIRAKEIADAKARKDKEALEALRNAPPPMPELKKPPVSATPPKLDNTTFREGEWDFILNDPKALPPEYLMPDLKKIEKVVKALKKETRIPGVHVFQKPPTVVRR
jgi:hypothetical protein